MYVLERNDLNGAWIGAAPIEERVEFVNLTLHVGEFQQKEPLENLFSSDYLKEAISKVLFNDGILKKIPLEIMSSNVGSFMANKMKNNTYVILEKEGPSLNMKITG